MYKITSFVVFILVLSSIVTAHEGHFDENEIYWSWDERIESGDFYTWDLTVQDADEQVNGLIDVEVVDQVSDINIREELEKDPNYLGTTPSLIMSTDTEISFYSTVYAPIHLVLPVQFNTGEGGSGNYFDLELYKNESIPLAYFTIGIINEFRDIEYTVEENRVFITGNFDSIADNTTGEFDVIYRKSGLLDYFEWTDNANNGHILELQESLLEELAIPTVPVLVALILLPLFTHYLVKLKED